jgi:membrane protease YdiL (CAAX protease family)
MRRQRTLAGVMAYCALVTGLAWVAPAFGGSPSSPGIGFIVWGTAPLLASLLIRAASHDWGDLGWRPGFRRNVRWYVVSIVAMPALMAGALALALVTGVAAIADVEARAYLSTVAAAIPVFLVFAVFEEVGWRGYLAPKLAAMGLNAWVAAAVVSVVWTAWHVPYLRELPWIGAGADLTAFVPRYALLLFALSLLQGELRAATSSFWPAVLLHGIGNAVGHPLAEAVAVGAGMTWLGSPSTGLYVVALAGLLGLAIWAMRRPTADSRLAA